MKNNFKIIASKDEDTKRLERLFTNVARMRGGKELLSSITLPLSVELAANMPSETTPATYDIESNHIRLNRNITNKKVLGKAFRDALKRAQQMEETSYPSTSKQHLAPKL